ncbi:MAG: TIGR00269 family protein [Candidatus Bathyarchaeia archaeon]
MPPTCTICKRRDAIYTRLYSGEKMCTKCFCLSIENKVRATISKYNMLSFDDEVAVGVSGGKDSMALLHVLAKLEKSFPRTKLGAIIVDEGICGYRDEALKIAKKGCQKLAVEHVVVSFEEVFGHKLDELVERLQDEKVDSRGLTPCAYCGVLRRRALNSAARDWGATKLATAHNLDDETQTILLNMLHGDPLRIVRIQPVSPPTDSRFVSRIKPFCEILEKETTLYAYLKRIEFQSIPCPYASTALRSDARAILNRMEEKHPGLKYGFYRSVEKLRFSFERTNEVKKIESCKVCGEPTVGDVCQVCVMLRRLKPQKRRGKL